MSADVVMNAQALANLLRSPSGPIARDLLVRATRVQTAARQLAPKRTGDLANSIVKRPITFAGRPAVDIGVFAGTAAGYALYVEQGTKAHTIRPRKRSVLVFYSPKVGDTVFARKVNHPGTKPTHFLLKALQRAIG